MKRFLIAALVLAVLATSALATGHRAGFRVQRFRVQRFSTCHAQAAFVGGYSAAPQQVIVEEVQGQSCYQQPAQQVRFKRQYVQPVVGFSSGYSVQRVRFIRQRQRFVAPVRRGGIRLRLNIGGY